jgi:hypothetical protein
MRLRSKAVVVATLALTSVGQPAEAETDSHCSFRLVPLRASGATIEARLEMIGCFETYEAAVEAGSGGEMDLDPTVTPETLSNEALSSVEATAGDVLIGTEYFGTGFGGDSRSYFASSTCSAGVIWSVSYVGDALNDRFSSGKGFGGCDDNRKFQHSNFGGAVKICTPNCSDYGSLSNQVSSLRWRP